MKSQAATDNSLTAVPDKSPNKSCTISCGMGNILCEIAEEIQQSTLKQLSKRSLKDILDQLKKTK